MDLVKTKYIFIYNTFFIKSSKQELLLYVRAISILETDNITITVTVPKKGHAWRAFQTVKALDIQIHIHGSKHMFTIKKK